MELQRSEKIRSTWKSAGGAVLFLISALSDIFAQTPQADFSVQTEACINEMLILSNNSVFGERHSWDFCEGDLMSPATTGLSAALTGAFNPKDMDVVEVDGGLYGFVTSRSTNAIYRVHFPRESDAAPVVTNLGNIGSLLSGPEQIKIVNEAGLWYGLVVNGATSSLIRLDFGTSLNNTPSAYHVLGGISTVNSGMDVVSSNGEWVAAVTNSATQKVTIINFGNSITNPLDLSDIVVTPSIPGISGADDVQLVYDDGSWFAFVVGFNSRSIHRLNFGPDWSSSPEMAVISGPAFTTNQRPSGVRVHPDAGRYVMFIQTFDGSLFRFDMGADIQNSSPAFSNLGNFGVLGNSVNLDLVKLNSAWHGFIINQSNLKVDRLLFEVVCPATTAVSEEEVPADIAYTEAGLYAVSLTIQDANAHTDYRSQYVTVTSLAAPQLEIMSENVCQTNVVHFQAQTMTEIVSYHWDFSDQSITSTSAAPDYQFSQSGIFDVALKAYASNGCSNTASKRITIFDAPVSSFWLPGSVCTNSNMLFLNTTPDVYNGNLSYEWYVDNNLISTSRDLNYIFTTTTAKTITLKTAIPGCEHEITQVTPTLEVGPIVDFSFSGTCQDEPFKFERQMSDLSDSYLWDFQDGQTSTDSDPTHPFASPGSYAVALTATNAQGCQTTKTRVVTVFAKPVVDFSVSESSYPCSGSPTRFQNRTTTADDSSITEWLWASNRAIEKVTSDEENPEIVFETPGTYPVSLTATTAAGCTATLEKDITIDPSPSTEFTHPPTCEDEPVLFTGPPDPLIESSYWEIGTSYSYDASPTHTFAAPGDYPLYAEFYGSNGCISRIRKTIHVPIPLTPDFSVIKNCVDHEAIFTDITNGIDAVATRTWDFGNGRTATTSSVSQIFAQQQTAPITLQVTTQSGCSYTTTKQVQILPAPVAEFLASPETGAYPLEVTFTNTSSAADHFEWEFLDGTGSASVDESPVYTFSTLGTFDVTLTAFNEQQCEDSFTRSVTTLAPLPDADIEIVQLVEQPDGSTKLIVTIHNKGNTILKNLPMTFDFAGGLSLSQTVAEPIMPGAQFNFVLNSAILNAESLQYLCVALDVRNDLSPEGNRSCGAFHTDFFVFAAYPNPTTHELTLEWLSQQSETITVSLTDRVGRTVLRSQVPTVTGLNSHTINVQALPAGLYLLCIDDGSSKKVQRIAVEHSK